MKNNFFKRANVNLTFENQHNLDGLKEYLDINYDVKVSESDLIRMAIDLWQEYGFSHKQEQEIMQKYGLWKSEQEKIREMNIID